MLGGGRCHNRHSLRDLRPESARPESEARTDRSSCWGNLSAHKSERAKELIEERGCQLLLYLPAYSSPEFNPIEEAFSKIKSALRKAQARTREALVEALGVAISAVTTRDAHGFFEHSGYHLPVHLL